MFQEIKFSDNKRKARNIFDFASLIYIYYRRTITLLTMFGSL